MDTQSLRIFLKVAESGSFSHAAERLFLTQSAVSKRVQQLEQQLNAKLFDRHNRTISLTEAGQALQGKARHILELVEDTERHLSNLNQHVSGALTIATSHHIGLHRLPPILRNFVGRYPDVQLKLEFMGSEGAYQAIQSRQVELALTTLDTQTNDHIVSTPLWKDEMVCVCAATHSLAGLEQIGLTDLAQSPAILPEHNTITFQLIQQVFAEHGLGVNSPMPTNYLETIKMMVSVGLGWSLLPYSMLDEQLHILEWPEQPIHRDLGVIHLEARTLSNAAQALIELLALPHSD